MNKDIVRSKIEKHPCYNKSAHDKYARIHLPVAPACNIQCNYCNRKYDCSNESRPGVTSGVLTPEEALEKVIVVRQAVENLSVVGIAGPGDALANPSATFETLRMLKSLDEGLIPCISTNGLALPDHLDEIAEVGIGHVTVTMNAVDPDIGKEIYSWVHFQERTYQGREAAELLLKRQIKGIKGLVSRGVLVKVNTVLIPGVNDRHIKAVASKIKELGVFIHNILPLMSKPEYGTKFSKENLPEPTIEQIAKARFDCAEIMGSFDQVMQHCRQCRADAIGKLGQEFDMDSISEEMITNTSVLKSHVLGRYRSFVAEKMEREIAGFKNRFKVTLVAVATENNSMADVSFKNARDFYVYEVSGWGVHLREIRTLNYDESEACIKLSGHLRNVAGLLHDCSAMVCSVAGKQAFKEMMLKGIILDTEGGYKLLEQAAWVAGSKRIREHVSVKTA